MGKLRYFLAGAIAALGIASIEVAQAHVVTTTVWDTDAAATRAAGNGVEDPNPSGVAVPLLAANAPIDGLNNSANVDGAHYINDIEANKSKSDVASVLALPEPSTWVMVGLWFAGVAFAAFRAPRKRPRALFS